MPPSVNRIIGIEWMGNLLYPEYYPVNICERTKNFYSLFYGVDVTDEQTDMILSNAVRVQ